MIYQGREGQGGSCHYIGDTGSDASAHRLIPKALNILLSNLFLELIIPCLGRLSESSLPGHAAPPRMMYPSVHYLIPRLLTRTNYLMIAWTLSCCRQSTQELVIPIVAVRTIQSPHAALAFYHHVRHAVLDECSSHHDKDNGSASSLFISCILSMTSNISSLTSVSGDVSSQLESATRTSRVAHIYCLFRLVRHIVGGLWALCCNVKLSLRSYLSCSAIGVAHMSPVCFAFTKHI